MANNFENKTFLFTGKLQHMKREEAEAKVKALGGKIVSSVTKTLSVLVATSETSAKWTKALELNSKGANIQLWTEEQFMTEQEKATSESDNNKSQKINIETLNYELPEDLNELLPEDLNEDDIKGYKDAYLVIIHAFVNAGWKYDPSDFDHILTKTYNGINYTVSIINFIITMLSGETGSIEIFATLENDDHEEENQLFIEIYSKETNELLSFDEVYKNAYSIINIIEYDLEKEFYENCQYDDEE